MLYKINYIQNKIKNHTKVKQKKEKKTLRPGAGINELLMNELMSARDPPTDFAKDFANTVNNGPQNSGPVNGVTMDMF